MNPLHVDSCNEFMTWIQSQLSSRAGFDGSYPLAELGVDKGQVLEREKNAIGPLEQLDLLDSPPALTSQIREVSARNTTIY